MSTDSPPLVGVGIYGVAEAARLTKVPAARIRRWSCGYAYTTGRGERHSDPVFRKDHPPIGPEVALSFLDLIEIRVVNELRVRKISWKAIRLAEQHAREIFGIEHPFATHSFKTDGRQIFAAISKTRGEAALLDLVNNQYTFRKMIEPKLEDIDFDGKQRAIRWWPMGSRHRVLLDPQRSFGQPIVREGVPTAILAKAAARESAQTVARWYEVELRAVRDAVDFEGKLAA